MSALPSSTAVLIVGAGPAGLATALALAVKEVPFVIVDALKAGQNGSRASLMHAHTLEELDRLGVAQALLAQGIQSKAMTFRDPEEHALVTVGYGELRDVTRFPISLLIPQHAVERILAARLRELGIEVARGHSAVAMVPARTPEGFAALEVAFEDGARVRAKYVVGADGSKSLIRTAAEIAYLDPHTQSPPEHTENDIQLVLADVYLADPLPASVPRDEGLPLFGADGIVFLVPLNDPDPTPGQSGHFFRFVASLPRGAPAPPSVPSAEYIQKLLDTRGPGSHTGGPRARVARVVAGSRYRTSSAIAAAFTKRIGDAHVLLAGDAAHKHSPAGGQGMNLGLCDGALLGGALAAHIAGGPDALFDTYATSRSAVALQVIDVAERLTSLANLKGSYALALRNMVLRAADRVPGVSRLIAWRVSGLAYA